MQRRGVGNGDMYVVITFKIDLNFPRFHIHQQVIRIVDEGDKFSLLMGLFPSWIGCWGRMHLGWGNLAA